MSQGLGLGASLGTPRAEIAQSWRRSAAYGLSPDQSLDDLPESSVELDSAFRAAALPLIEQAAADLDPDGYVFLLADQDARLIDRFGRPSKFQRVLEEHSVRRGVLFSEETAGTNALGMALDLRRQVCVRSGEHYVEALRPVACVGQPVIHPITRRALGVLNLSGDDSVTGPLARRLVRDYVTAIERRILERSSRAQVNLLTAFRTASARRARPVVALDDDVVLANRSALDLLQTDDFGALHGLLLDAGAGGGDETHAHLRLASGALADVHIERVEGTRRGLLFSLQCAEPGELVLPRGAAPLDAADASARASVTAAPGRAPLRLAGSTPAPAPRHPGECALFSGPPASGRTTAAHDLAQGRTVVTIDVGLALLDHGAAWLEALTAACAQPAAETLVLVEEIGLLPEPMLIHLSTTLRRVDRPDVVMTSAPPEDLTGRAAAVAGACPRRTALPALVERRHELRELAQRLIADLNPDANLRLTPSVLTALAAHHWPGNLGELRMVMEHVCAHRSTGDVGLRDLPEDYRSPQPTRQLGGLERAERDAIIRALSESGGNKAKAAAQLGISRTTLYARIRQLRVTA